MPRRTWTDDDLRAAVADANSWAAVIRELGLADSGDVRGQLRVAARRLDLDVTQIELRRGRRWSDAQLRDAVATSSNLHGVFLALGLRVGGGAWSRMQDHIDRLELDTTHWTSMPSSSPTTSSMKGDDGDERAADQGWSDEKVRAAADGARSVADVMRRLSLDPKRKRGRRAVERRLRECGIDPGGFAGQAWAAGRRTPRRRRPLEEVLVRGSHVTTSDLRRRLLEEGVLDARCASCGRERWLQGPIPLQLDHIDGDRSNNELPNLRVLCPNCHALTDTYCGRNIGRR